MISFKVKETDAEYAKYFGKGGAVNPFRTAVREVEKETRSVDTMQKGQGEAALKGNARKRKAGKFIEKDLDAGFPLVAKTLEAEARNEVDLDVNIVGTLANLKGTKGFHVGEHAEVSEGVTKVSELQQMKAMMKWAERRLKMGEETELTSIVMNIETLSGLQGSMTKLDSGIAPGKCEMVFTTEKTALEPSVIDYQITKACRGGTSTAHLLGLGRYASRLQAGTSCMP